MSYIIIFEKRVHDDSRFKRVVLPSKGILKQAEQAKWLNNQLDVFFHVHLWGS